jgi:hypothetical protein
MIILQVCYVSIVFQSNGHRYLIAFYGMLTDIKNVLHNANSLKLIVLKTKEQIVKACFYCHSFSSENLLFSFTACIITWINLFPNFNLFSFFSGDQQISCQQYRSLLAARDPTFDRRKFRPSRKDRKFERKHEAPQTASQALHEEIDRRRR